MDKLKPYEHFFDKHELDNLHLIITTASLLDYNVSIDIMDNDLNYHAIALVKYNCDPVYMWFDLDSDGKLESCAFEINRDFIDEIVYSHVSKYFQKILDIL